MHSYNFLYFIIIFDINIIIEFIGEEVKNSDNFVLNKYSLRSSLYKSNTYNKLVIHNLFKSVLGRIIEITILWNKFTMFTKML